MNQLLSGLSVRERNIIEMTFGMNGGREMSPTDISKEMEMSAERIRQIRNEALQKLRKLIYLTNK
jgi:RNA polymerase sigma factor (sigma-70 family)